MTTKWIFEQNVPPRLKHVTWGIISDLWDEYIACLQDGMSLDQCGEHLTVSLEKAVCEVLNTRANAPKADIEWVYQTVCDYILNDMTISYPNLGPTTPMPQ